MSRGLPQGPMTLPDDDFSTLFAFLPIGAYRSSPDGRQLRANPALVRLNGFDSEAEQLAAVVDIAAEWYVDPQQRAYFMQTLERDGRIVAFESEVHRYKTRERIWISENAHAVRDADGRVLYYEGTVEEITERVLARQALRRSQQHLQQIVDLMPGMVYRTAIMPSGQRHATYVSDGIRDLFDLPPEAMLSDHSALYRLFHPDDRDRVAAETKRAALTRAPLQTELRVVLYSGETKWVHLISAPAPCEDGQAVRVGIIFDITARKQAELALDEHNAVWKRVLESLGDGVWDLDVATGDGMLSDACKRMYGYADDELPDRVGALDALIHPDDAEAMRRAREDHYAGRTATYVSEHRMHCKDGSWKPVLSRGVVIARDIDGKPLRMIGTDTDITERRQAEALRMERDRAAAADLAKSQFLSRVSHELRTPLNAILGFAQLLEIETAAGSRQAAWLQQVLGSGRHLLGLMDDILDLSTAQTGQLRMDIVSLDLRPLVQEVCGMVAPTAAHAGVDIESHLPIDQPVRVLADPKRLKQVLSNLLGNAIKYNVPGGRVWLEVRQRARHVEIDVVDDGPGIDTAEQSLLFQPFERLGAHRGPVQGTGLGLSLVRELAMAMRGSIALHSEPGEGAIFRLRLPAG